MPGLSPLGGGPGSGWTGSAALGGLNSAARPAAAQPLRVRARKAAIRVLGFLGLPHFQEFLDF